MPVIALWSHRLFSKITNLRQLIPGLSACAIVALASQFIALQYRAPAMLMALLLGIALQFLSANKAAAPGIAFSSRSLLRISVALLGARISFDLLLELGAELVLLVIAAVIATILFGQVVSHFFQRGWRLATITAGSVAICGASAAIAIAAVLPKNKHSERNMSFTIMSVTILSTIAMIIYPAISRYFGMDDLAAGLFFGGSIHDVAQVVGAGFSISDAAGDTATLVKLIRVAMLAPVVICLSLLVRRIDRTDRASGKKPPLLPGFVIGFLVLATLTSFHLIPQPLITAASQFSAWGLLTAIAAVGMKTSIQEIQSVGRTAIYIVVLETLFIAGFVLVGMYLLA